MCLIINLEDDLYGMARSHAIATKTYISKAVGDLLRQRTAANTHPVSEFSVSESNFHIDPERLLPVVKGSGTRIEAQISRAMDDDHVRPLQIMGLLQ